MTIELTRPSAAATRYADPFFAIGATSEVVELQLRRRSVRRFLPGGVSDGQLRTLIAAAQSAPTSSNLQPWSVVAVRHAGRKERLAALAAGQGFVAQAPLLLVWVADLGRHRRVAARVGTSVAATDYLETALIGFIDTALAAQNAVLAAESLGLGSVFVGAVRNRPEEIAAELRLPPHAVAAFGLAVGEPDRTERAGVKPRPGPHPPAGPVVNGGPRPAAGGPAAPRPALTLGPGVSGRPGGERGRP
jgi:nitroreductase